MTIRSATPQDAGALHAIYAPVVRDTAISFELQPPTVEEMRARVTTTLKNFPWFVSLDAQGKVNGYVYAGKHRERAAYQWSVDTTAYVRADSRQQGVGRALYEALFVTLAGLGYYQAFAGITLPNAASVALHESLGFKHVGIYRDVGYKLGAWHDVGWWQRSLRPLQTPVSPAPYVPIAPSVE